MAVVEVDRIGRRYGSLEALADVSFTVERSQIVGLLGPNGAGKTTMMKILTGLVAPTAGTARVAGHDVVSEPVEVRRQLGWLPEGAPLYPEMEVGGFLRFIAQARGLRESGTAVAIDRLARATGLQDRLRQQIGTLSRGFRQRVGLAQALLHAPPILVLDEPTTGLDPNQVAEMRDLVRQVGQTRTVLLSTHILSEVVATCDRVVILHHGRVVADDTTARVTAAVRGASATVGLARGKVQIDQGELVKQLSALPSVTGVQALATQRDVRRFTVHAETDVRAEVFQWAVAGGHVLVELTEASRSLEEVFRNLTETT